MSSNQRTKIVEIKRPLLTGSKYFPGAQSKMSFESSGVAAEATTDGRGRGVASTGQDSPSCAGHMAFQVTSRYS